jgi:hypothetical protein
MTVLVIKTFISRGWPKDFLNIMMITSVPVLALPAPWARFQRCPPAIQTHTKKGRGFNEITNIKTNNVLLKKLIKFYFSSLSIGQLFY